MRANTLQNLGDLPPFEAMDDTSIVSDIRALLKEVTCNLASIKSMPIQDVTWHNTVEPLTTLVEKVALAWGVVAHLNSVADTPLRREALQVLTPEVSGFFAALEQDHELFLRFEKISESEEFSTLTKAQQAKLKHDLRDFILGGAKLNVEERQQLMDLKSRAAELSLNFSQNVMDATDSFALYVEDEEILSGVQEDAKALFRAAAESEGQAGYKIGLHMPHYLAVMQFAHNRNLRETIYRAYSVRASDLCDWGQGDALDNTANISECLNLAHQEARLLGFESYAHLSLATKMASTPVQVLEFLRDLAKRARPFAEQDLKELRDFAADHLGLSELLPWDVAYVSEKLRQAQYAFSETEVKQYFPVAQVLQGLFGQVTRLYGVEFVESAAKAWHEDVRYFTLMRKGRAIGSLYVDLFARHGKRSGAWMNDYCNRRLSAGSLRLPVAYLVCNFTPPAPNKVAYLGHQEIITLFHEMGHGLHHLLTEIDEPGVAGISGVEWDAVELPSQFMENFAWEYETLASMSAHEVTGEILPRALFDKMIAAKNFQKGLMMVRQMEFALFDMLIYSAGENVHWQQILQDVREEVAVIMPPDYNRFAHSFSHIFAGGYAAGYYSYAWAEVLSADAYAAFETCDDVRAMGERFWREILSVGGSRSALESFKAFRGREPDSAALLRQSGLISAA